MAAFWKTNGYAPWPVWIWLNGHELGASGNAPRPASGTPRWITASVPVRTPQRCRGSATGSAPGAVNRFFWRWQARLPSPFTRADLRAGYVYELAFRQFEMSDTRVFDRPAAGRSFFEGLIRDHLDVGRPESVSLIFDRRVTGAPRAPAAPRSITKGVDPQVSCYYKSSRIKQYFKEHRALRTETVICDTRDFGIGRRVTAENWKALRAVGEHANQRLCDAQAADARPAPDIATFAEVTRPPSQPTASTLQHCAFGDPRVMAVLAAVVGFTHLIAGFDNRAPDRTRLRPARHPLHQPARHLRPAAAATANGLIDRLPGTHRYRLTPHGRRDRRAVHQGLRPDTHPRR